MNKRTTRKELIWAENDHGSVRVDPVGMAYIAAGQRLLDGLQALEAGRPLPPMDKMRWLRHAVHNYYHAIRRQLRKFQREHPEYEVPIKHLLAMNRFEDELEKLRTKGAKPTRRRTPWGVQGPVWDGDPMGVMSPDDLDELAGE